MNVSVLGLSGQQDERGYEGVGKSCLCNRIVRPTADDYHEQNPWLLSSSDFNSRVVNSDHFLYWGIAPVNTAGSPYNVNLVEQTEFIHDETLRSFPSQYPYLKRATSVRLKSLDKLAYFSKFQLGFETEYPNVPMPSELNIDGFIFCYDVSFSHFPEREKQDRLLVKAAQELHKSRRPVVIAATKMDNVHSDTLVHLYDLISSNRYLRNCCVVETSAKVNVNINYLISTMVGMITKSIHNGKFKTLRYAEAFSRQVFYDNQLTEDYKMFLKHHVLNWYYEWDTFRATFSANLLYQNVTERFGINVTKNFFQAHISHLCSETAKLLLRQWLCELPAAFADLLADWEEINNCLEADTVLSDSDLEEIYRLCLPKFCQHKRFSMYFQRQRLFASFNSFPRANEQQLLRLVEHDKHIPEDILEFPEAFNTFKSTFRSLKRRKMAKHLCLDLKKNLESDFDYLPGYNYEESLDYLKKKYGGRFDDLDESDLRSVFDEMQRKLADNAILDLRNLIEQNCAEIVFDSTTFLDIAVDKAERVLSSRTRYRRCERLPQLRTQVIRDWLASARSGESRKCPGSSPQFCMANRLRQALSVKPHSSPRRLAFVLIGSQRDSSIVENTSKINWPDGLLKTDLSPSAANTFRIDIVRHGEAFIADAETSVTSRSILKADVLMILVSNVSSLNMAKQSLASAKATSINAAKMLCALPQSEEGDFYAEAKRVAECYSAEFIDSRFGTVPISQAIAKFAASTQQQLASACSPKTPDLRIAVLCRCADSYSAEFIIRPFTKGPCYHLDPGDSSLPSCVSVVRQHLFLDSHRRTVQLLFLPYHARANPNVYHAIERAHGIILAFDPSSPHSFATMASEANRRSGIPLYILAVKESDENDNPSFSETTQNILNDAARLGERLSARFVKTDIDFPNQPAAFTPFIRSAFDNREETEKIMSARINKPPITPNSAADDIKNLSMNSIGKSSQYKSQVSSRTSQGLSSIPGGKETAKKDWPIQSPNRDCWPIEQHPVDPLTGASLPIAVLLRSIEDLGGHLIHGIYRISGNSQNSQKLLNKLKLRENCDENFVKSNFDVPTIATTVKAVISKSNILADDVAMELLELFSTRNENLKHSVSSFLESKLPKTPHRQTLLVLLSHMRHVSNNQPEAMNSQNLARVFWPSLLHNLTQNLDNIEKATRLQFSAETALVFMIENSNDLFPENV